MKMHETRPLFILTSPGGKKMKKLLPIFASLAFLLPCGTVSAQGRDKDNTKNWLGGLPPEKALSYMKENHDKGLVIVEVNTDYWKLKNGFTGAMHIPHDQMAERYAEIPSGAPVILHCGAGVVSVPAYETLKEKRPDIPVLSYIAGRPPVSEFNGWLSEHRK